eukprot:Gb_17278 [translate_table: standard]
MWDLWLVVGPPTVALRSKKINLLRTKWKVQSRELPISCCSRFHPTTEEDVTKTSALLERSYLLGVDCVHRDAIGDLATNAISPQVQYCPGKSNLDADALELRNAPRIYQNLHSRCDDENSKNYKDSKDVQWIRTIDFTQSCSIGQSSSLCLELHNGMNISQIQGKFAHYEEIEEKLSLEYGTPFSSSLKLVPIINSPESIQLPYRMMFKINSLVQRGILSGPTLGKEFFDLLQPSRRPLAHINQALAKLGNSGWHMCYEPVKWLQKQFDKIEKSERHFDSPEISLDNGLMYVHRVQVTPSKVYFTGPEVNVSNRVTRHYAKYIDNFLRVSFVDENLNTLYSSDLRMGYGARETRTEIYKRILSVLAEGIVIGNKKFEFLAFSSSQLRESSVWMFASADTVNADSIRKWMGDFFAIKNVAKCATRMGQSFSSSTETLDVYEHEIDFISDIEVDSGSTRYTFSDGIGKISLSLAKQVAIKCGCDKRIPSAFQIRYGGYKGVVAVDPKSSWKLSLRRSMWKYNSKNTSLDVLSWTRFGPCFLNRQIITLLSTLGVEDHHFEMLQKQAVTLMDQLLTNRDKALDVLQIMFAGENHNVFTEMLSCGYSPAFEPYLSMMLHAFRASKLLELKNKARIFVSKGRCLMGCLDETRTLKYGEVFIQASHAPGNRQSPDAGLSAFGQNGLDHTTSIVEGKVIVAKNPCLHPGDVRILLAVNIPSLHHMVDCIVFPQQGLKVKITKPFWNVLLVSVCFEDVKEMKGFPILYTILFVHSNDTVAEKGNLNCVAVIVPCAMRITLLTGLHALLVHFCIWPHPSECSGSDLDGDVYFISWDESLIPPQQDAPMDYVARPPVEQDHEVTIKVTEGERLQEIKRQRSMRLWVPSLTYLSNGNELRWKIKSVTIAYFALVESSVHIAQHACY